VIIIFGSNATLDGRFLNGAGIAGSAGSAGSAGRDDSNNGKTWLELHDITFKNANSDYVSSLCLMCFSSIFEHI
jgi:hypothetical protein